MTAETRKTETENDRTRKPVTHGDRKDWLKTVAIAWFITALLGGLSYLLMEWSSSATVAGAVTLTLITFLASIQTGVIAFFTGCVAVAVTIPWR